MRSSFCIAMVFVAGVGSVALGQPAPPANEPPSDLDAARRAVFVEAVRAWQDKDWATCQVKALGVWGAKQHPQTAALLGICEAELGKYAEAAEHLDYHRQNDKGNNPGRTKDVKDAWDKVSPKITTVSISIDQTGVEILVDGKPRGQAPLSVYIVADANIEAKKQGFKTERFAVKATPGKTENLNITLDKDTALPPSDGRPSWPGWLMGGGGLALAVTGAALIGVGQSKPGSAEEIGNEIRAAGGSCEPATGPSSERCVEVDDELSSAATLTNAGIGVATVGGALLIAGVIYLALPNERPAEAPVSGWVGPGTYGILFNGAF